VHTPTGTAPAVDDLDTYVDALVDSMPPLTAAARTRFAAILKPTTAPARVA
jgi:hypothetical protein